MELTVRGFDSINLKRSVLIVLLKDAHIGVIFYHPIKKFFLKTQRNLSHEKGANDH